MPHGRTDRVGLFLDILVPAIPVLARLEERGIPLHIPTRNSLRRKTQARLDRACERIAILAQEAHQQRLARIQAAIDRLATQRTTLRGTLPACPTHPKYIGLNKRAKSECCMVVFAAAATARAQLKDLQARTANGRAKLKQVGIVFDAKNDWHWRFLLFDELGLNLPPATWTDKTATPKVDEHAIEILQRRHPEVELLTLRVDIQETKTRLSVRLAVEPEEDGRAHTPYAIHRTWNQRVTSGNDESEAEEVRHGAGNFQNIPKRDRMMYRAEPGKIFIQPDLSQVEARVQAWLAKDIKMLSAWRDGMDIHAMTAAAIYGVPEEETKTHMVKIEGTLQPMRQMGKKRRHGGNYGMGDGKFADMTGIPISEARRISTMDRKTWPRLYEFQKEEVQHATRDKSLRNPFGKLVRFYSWRRNRETGEWEIDAREEALSFRPASTVACMIIAMLEPVDDVPDGELLTTTHDSYLSQVDFVVDMVVSYVAAVREIMSREWPQLGEIPGFGFFRCPVDFKVGMNWGEIHVCKPNCPNRSPETPEDPCEDSNPDGLEDYDKWLLKSHPSTM